MEKATKKKIIIASVIGGIILLFYLFVIIFYKEAEQEFLMEEYPSGFVTNSQFDLQNMDRKEYETMPVPYLFEHVPVEGMLPQGKVAKIEDASFVEWEERILMTLSVDKARQGEVENIVLRSITKILNENANPENTVMNALWYESGYINGCSGNCYTIEFIVEGVEVPFYAVVYDLVVSDSICDNENRIVVGCISSGNGEEYFWDRYNYATALVLGFKYVGPEKGSGDSE